MDVSRTQSKRMQLFVWLAAMLAVLITLPVTARAEVAHGESGTVKWSISDAGELVFEPKNGSDGTFGKDLRENDGSYQQHVWTQYIYPR